MKRKKATTAIDVPSGHLLAVKDWCPCQGWKEMWPYLQNYNEMNFCIACGKKLTKRANAQIERLARSDNTLRSDVGFSE